MNPTDPLIELRDLSKSYGRKRALDRVRLTVPRGVVLGLARVKFEVRRDLERVGFIDRIGADMVFATLPTAVQAYRDWAAQTEL